MVIEESGIKFEFSDTAIKYDDTEFYREIFNKFPDSKGVDFISDTDEFLVFTEVKNCTGDEANNNWRIHPNNTKVATSSTKRKVEDRQSLDIEVVQKVAMTISALIGAQTFGDKKKSSEELLEYAKAVESEKFSRDKKKILVILFLEGDFGSVSKSKKKIMKDLQDSMNKKLRWLNCRASVVDSDTYNKKIFKLIK